MTDLLKAFNEMLEESDRPQSLSLNSKVLIVDGLNTFVRAFCSVPTMDLNGNHIGGTTGFFKSIAYTIRLHKPTRVFVVFDGKNGSQRRKKLYPEYKKHRKPISRVNRTYDMGSDKDEQDFMKYEMMLIIKVLKHLPMTTVVLDNVEADDIIAYISHLTNDKGGNSIIYSTDKDFLQLIRGNTKVWNPIKKKMYDENLVVEDYGVHPHNFVLYRALTGDLSDNIPGIKGMGQKTMLKHFPKMATPDIVALEEIYDICSESKSKTLQHLLENKGIVERNLKLMQLAEVNISGNSKLSVIDKFNELPPEFRKYDLTKLLIERHIISALGNYEEWASASFNQLTRFNLHD